MKKIIHVVPEFGLAGAETMVENLVNNIDKKNYQIKLISLYNYHSPITERLEKNGYEIIYLDKKKGIDLSIIRKLKKVFKEEKPDIIHTHRYVLEYVVPANNMSCKSKIIHTVHNVANKEVDKKRRILQKRWFKKFNITPVGISDIIKDTIVKEYNLNPKKVPVVLNAIDMSKCIKKLDYSNTYKILNIGRLAEQKNQKFLIDVFYKVHQRHPEYKLKIIGNGPLYDEIHNQIISLGLEKFVEIEKDKPSCFEDLNNSDIFILTSKWEGVPMTIIEALGTGLPILSSNVGGISNMIENGVDGILINLDEEEFVNNIIELMENKNKREQLGINALKKSKIFTAKEMAKKYQKIYESNDNLYE